MLTTFRRLPALVQRASLIPWSSASLSTSDFGASLAHEDAPSALGTSPLDTYADVLHCVALLGGSSVLFSSWSKLKRHALWFAEQQDQPKLCSASKLLLCFQILRRHRALAKPEATRFQEVFSAVFSQMSTREQIVLIHELALLDVEWIPALRLSIEPTLHNLVEHATEFELLRLAWSLRRYYRDALLPDTAVSALVTRTSGLRLLSSSQSERIYLLWCLSKLVLHRSLVFPMYVALLFDVLGLAPTSAVSNPISVDVLLGKAGSDSQLTPRDVLLLLMTLCAVVQRQTGGDTTVSAAFATKLMSHKRSPLGDEPVPAVTITDSALLGELDRASGMLLGHINVLCSHVVMALLSCKLCCVEIGVPLLRTLTSCGIVYCSSSAQLAVHLLMRHTLFQYRDAVYFCSAGSSASPMLHYSPSGEPVLDLRVTVLAAADNLSEEEQQLLLHRRLATDAALQRECPESDTALLPSVPCFTAFVEATIATRALFSRSAPCHSADEAQRSTFAEFYDSLVIRLLPRVLKAAVPSLKSTLIHLALKGGFVRSSEVANLALSSLLMMTPSRHTSRMSVRNADTDTLRKFAAVVTTNPALLTTSDMQRLHGLMNQRPGSAGEPAVELNAVCDLANRSTCTNDEVCTAVHRLTSSVTGFSAMYPSSCLRLLLLLGASRGLVLSEPSNHLLWSLRAVNAARTLHDKLVALYSALSTKSLPAAEPALALLASTFDDINTTIDGSTPLTDAVLWVSCVRLGRVPNPRSLVAPAMMEQIVNAILYGREVPLLCKLEGLASLLYCGADLSLIDLTSTDFGDQSGVALPVALATELALCSWRSDPRTRSRVMRYVTPWMVRMLEMAATSHRFCTLPVVAAYATWILTVVDPSPDCSWHSAFFDVVRQCLLGSRLSDGFQSPQIAQCLSRPSGDSLWSNVAYVAMVSQALQMHASTDTAKRFGALLWRSCLKACDKMAVKWAPLRTAATATMTEQGNTGNVLSRTEMLTTASMLVRFGASSRAIDDLVFVGCFMRSGHLPILCVVDLVAVGMLSDAMFVSGKRRISVTECVVRAVVAVEFFHTISALSAHHLASMIFATQCDDVRARVSHAVTEYVGSVLWNAVDLRLTTLRPVLWIALLATLRKSDLESRFEEFANHHRCPLPRVEEIREAINFLASRSWCDKGLAHFLTAGLQALQVSP